jgi:hypothetical protein
MISMRKILLIFLSFIFFIFNFVLSGRAGDEAEREAAARAANKQVQQLKVKEENRKWELSAAASLGIKIEPHSLEYPLTFIMAIPARVGYFFTKNIEIEPEINFIYNFNDYYESTTLFLANISYNFSPSSKTAPFLIGGAGIIRIPAEGWFTEIERPVSSCLALNAGGGVKWFAARRVALRFEYRFLYYSRHGDIVFHNQIFMGFSLFL